MSAGDNKFILFTHHLVNSLDFLGSIVKQQILDSVVYAPVEDQQRLLCEFVTKKSKRNCQGYRGPEKQNVIDAKLAEKQAKIDEKKRLKEEKENAKKQEKERLKEEKRCEEGA